MVWGSGQEQGIKELGIRPGEVEEETQGNAWGQTRWGEEGKKGDEKEEEREEMKEERREEGKKEEGD